MTQQAPPLDPGVSLEAMRLWNDRRLRLSLTGLGAQYLLALLAVGAFSVNTGNNLFYLVFSLMLGLFLASGWVSRRAIQDLELVAVEEGNLFARVQGGVKVRFRDRAPGRVRCLEVRLEAEHARVEPGFHPGGGRTGEDLQLVLQVQAERRGDLRVARLELRTAFPFGLMEKAWAYPLSQDFLILPHPRALSSRQLREGDLSQPRPRPGSPSLAPPGKPGTRPMRPTPDSGWGPPSCGSGTGKPGSQGAAMWRTPPTP